MSKDITEKFINSFHSLPGVTIGARRKNLNLLLKATRNQLQAPAQLDLSSLQPKTLLEESFRIFSMLYFRNTSNLLEILTEGNPVLASKILTPWFTQEVGKLPPNTFIEIFSRLSYRIKVKLLHKLSRHLNDTEKSDELFHLLDQVYGLDLASKLLCSCSKSLIIEIIEVVVKVTPRQLLTICKKYPESIETFFEKLDKQGGNYANVFYYLGQHHVDLFLKLFRRYKVAVTLGPKATRSVVLKEREKIMQEPRRYFSFLSAKRLGWDLKNDLHEFYPELFPQAPRKLKKDLGKHFTLLRTLSKSARLELLLQAFRAKHGRELWDYPVFVNMKLIGMMTPRQREKWMEQHSKPDDIPWEKWVCFMKTNKSIPLLTEQIVYTSKTVERSKLMRCLILTCVINKDKAALAEIVKYVLRNHKGDDVEVLDNFILALGESFKSFKVTEFGEGFWDAVHQLISFAQLSMAHYKSVEKLLDKYILYRFESGSLKSTKSAHCPPVEDLLIQWLQLDYGSFNSFAWNPKHERKAWAMLLELIPRAFAEDQWEEKYVDCLSGLDIWNVFNERHDKIPVDVNREALGHLKANLEKSWTAWAAIQTAEGAVQFFPEKAQAEGLPAMLMKKDKFVVRELFVPFLSKNPLFVRDHLQEIFSRFIRGKGCNIFQKNVYRYYSHLGIPQGIAAICREAVRLERGRKLNQAAAALAQVVAPEEFLDLVKYDESADLKVYEQNQALLSCFKHVIPRSKVVDVVLKLHDDYAHVTKDIAYSILVNVPEGEALSLLTQKTTLFSNHVLYSFNAFDKKTVLQLFTNLEDETNTATLTKGLVNFFLRNPDEHVWNFLQQNVKTDNRHFFKLIRSKRVPRKFLGRYVLNAWNLLRFGSCEQEKNGILEMIDNDAVKELPEEFFLAIKDELFKAEALTRFQKNVQAFVCKYVIHNGRVKLDAIVVDLKNYVRAFWRSPKLHARKLVSNFVKEFCSNFLGKTCRDKELLLQFASSWEGILKPHEAFHEYLHLKFTLLFVENFDENVTMFSLAEKVINLWNSLENKHLGIFADCFNTFRDTFFTLNDDDSEINEVLFVQSLMSYKTEFSNKFALSLISNSQIDDHVDVLDHLMQEDAEVQICLHNCLINEANPEEK